MKYVSSTPSRLTIVLVLGAIAAIGCGNIDPRPQYSQQRLQMSSRIMSTSEADASVVSSGLMPVQERSATSSNYGSAADAVYGAATLGVIVDRQWQVIAIEAGGLLRTRGSLVGIPSRRLMIFFWYLPHLGSASI